jgi:O-antigen/teichoic acid export membrane protein
VLNFTDGAITAASALVVSVLLARALGPAEFGKYALVMSIVIFALLFAQLGISGTVRRYTAELDGRGDPGAAAAVAGRGLRLALMTGMAGSLVLAALANPLAAFFRHGELRGYLMIGAVMVLPMIVLGVLRGIATGLQRYRFLVALNLVTSPLWVAGCALAVLTGAGVAGVLVATLVIDLVQLATLGWWASAKVGIRWRAPLPEGLRIRLRRYNATLAVLIFLNAVVWERSELLFLGRFHGPDQISFYAIPFALTERVVNLIPGAILGVLLPGLTYAQSIDPARFSAMFSQALRNLAVLTLPICLLGIPLAPAVVGLLYGSGYDGAIVVLQILLVAVIFGVLGQASRSALLGIESQGWLLKTGVAAAAFSVLLDLLLIPRWGAIGAAIANTLVQAGWALALFGYALQRIRRLAPMEVLAS